MSQPTHCCSVKVSLISADYLALQRYAAAAGGTVSDWARGCIVDALADEREKRVHQIAGSAGGAGATPLQARPKKPPQQPPQPRFTAFQRLSRGHPETD